MKLGDQVVSLELAKKLKDLGFKQESLFYWVNTPEGYLLWDKAHHNGEKPRDTNMTTQNPISAYTVAELGEMLPNRLVGDHPLWYLTIHCNDQYYNISYETFNGVIEKDFGARDKKEADARVKMLIYLKENKLI